MVSVINHSRTMFHNSIRSARLTMDQSLKAYYLNEAAWHRARIAHEKNFRLSLAANRYPYTVQPKLYWCDECHYYHGNPRECDYS